MDVEVSRVYVPRVGSFLVNVNLHTDGPPRNTSQADIAHAFEQVIGVKSARPAVRGSAVWEISVYDEFNDFGRDKLREVGERIVARENA
jgi:hypothetical protein